MRLQCVPKHGSAGPVTCAGNSSPRLAAMQAAFRSTGGVISGDAFAILLREHCDQPISLLARWIVDRHIVSFEAFGQRWVPMFQFDTTAFRVNVGAHGAMGELRDVFDDWELAEWFATPNAWLAGASPAALVAGDPEHVMDAARADRFVATG